MKRIMRIGFDVDGVLADFNHGFSEFAGDNQKKFEIFPDRPLHIVTTKEEVRSWDWSWYPEYTADLNQQAKNLTEIGKVWAYLMQSENWWLTHIQPMFDLRKLEKALDKLPFELDIYFISTRVPTLGFSPQVQTAFWLIRHGMSFPSVIITENKGMIARALRLELFFEDNHTHVNDIMVTTSGRTKVVINDFPYNRHLVNDERYCVRIGKDGKKDIADEIMECINSYAKKEGYAPAEEEQPQPTTEENNNAGETEKS